MKRKIEEIEKILKSPTLFSIHLLKIKPFKYQAKILEDDAKRILIVGGRNIGKTTVLAIKSLWNAFVKPNYEVLIVAPTLRQARIVYDEIRKLISKSAYIYKRANITLHETKFDNDSVIRIVPVGEKGNIARGFHPDMLIFDEVAFMPDEAVYSIEPSVLPKDGTIIYSSTPYGKHNRFYELYQYHLNDADWSVYQIPSWECPLVSDNYLDEMRRTMPEALYMQEFGAKFLDEVGMLYSYSEVLRNASDYSYYPSWDGKSIMGVDVAGSGSDESAVVIVSEIDEGVWKVIYANTYGKITIKTFADKIFDLAERYGVVRINIERNGVGEGLYQELVSRSISGIDVNGFYAVGKERLNMYLNVKTLLEQNRLVLNKNDKKMLLQSANYELKEGKDGSLRVLKGRGHDDLWDALVYALYDRTMRVGIIEGMEVVF